MKKELFTDGLSHVDVDEVERLLRIEQDLHAKKARQKHLRLLLIPAAALLALLVCLTAVVIPFIPKTLDIEYEPSKGLPETVWVYYVNDRGAQKRERVNLPGGTANVFEAWKHLNEVDDQVQIVSYDVQEEPAVSIDPVPNTLWEFLRDELAPASSQKTVTVTLSPQITSYDNYDALIDSLVATLAKYAGTTPEQVKILIDGEQTIIPPPSFSGISGNLKFSYSMHNATELTIPRFAPGSTFELTVSMTNISDTDVIYHGSEMAFYPEARLFTTLAGDEAFELKPEEREITNEYAEHRLAPGETRTITYVFNVPEIVLHGKYDLILSFGENRCYFPQVLTISASTSVSDVEFGEFLQKYGFYTTNPKQFRAAIENLSFSGMDLFDLMTRARIDYAEGYSGEEYGSQWFSYGYTTLPNGNSNNYFVAKKVPDDVRLPYGITFADTLYHSLGKMGIPDAAAKELITRMENGEDQQIPLGNNALCLTRDQSGNYVIRYSVMISLSSSKYPPVYTLDIVYSRAEMIAQVLLIKAGVDNFSTDAFTTPIHVSGISQSSLGKELDPEDAQMLVDIFLSYIGTWNNGEVDVIYDYCITSAGKAYLYSTSAGVLADSGGYMGLSNEHRLIVNEIITKGNYQPNFGSILLVEPPDGSSRQCNLPDIVSLQIKNALNRAEWQDGTLMLDPLLWFDCDGTRVGYSGGIFFTTQHYCHVDSYTADCLYALRDAIVGLRTEQYDAIVYYAGTYFGHSEAVDEKLNGTVNFSMNMQPQPLDDILCAYNDKQAADALGDIVDCKNAVDKGVLVTNNGAYFERITEIKPDLSRGEVKLIETAPGLPPTCELTPDDAQTLREIFQRAEFTYCFGDDDAVYETTIAIGDYTIAYRSSSRDARIGDLKATLSEEDAQTVAEIIRGYISVG